MIDEFLSALLNVVLLGGLPFLVYFLYHRRRYKRGFGEIAQRAGLQLGETRYLAYSAVVAFALVLLIVFWPPSVESSVREGSAFKSFEGLGLSANSVILALLYGVVKTGFAEELLFRGLIAGSLSRRLSLLWANVVQSLIFLAPHLLVLLIAPEMWTILPLVFVGSLFAGWIRIKSGSILGSWLIHAAVNVAMGLSVAIRSAA